MSIDLLSSPATVAAPATVATESVVVAVPPKDWKSLLYGRFEAGEKWKTAFFRKLAYKSVDLEDNDVNIEANRVVTNHFHGPTTVSGNGGAEPMTDAAGGSTPVETSASTSTAQSASANSSAGNGTVRRTAMATAARIALGTAAGAAGLGIPFGAGWVANQLLNPAVEKIIERPGAPGALQTTTQSVDVNARARIEPPSN